MPPSDRAPDRRRAPRRATGPDEPISQIRLRAGRQLTVIDVSDVGLMSEGEMRLLPGTHVEVHLVTSEGRLLVRSRVIRVFVCDVSASQVRYRGALSFERPVYTGAVGYAIPAGHDGRASEPGKPYPEPVVPPLLQS